MSDKLREAKDLVREADTLLQGRITGNLQLGKTDYKRLVAILSRDLPAALSAPQADPDYYAIQSALSPHMVSSTELMAAMSSIWPLIKSPQADAEPAAYVPVHPRNGELWAETYAADSDVSQCRSASYPTRALYTAPPAPSADMRRALEPFEVRAGINILLETIAKKFEEHDTLDLWRSDAAIIVRSFKLQSLSRADDGKESEGGASCQRCQGNGEIVTDWETYLHPTDLKAEEASVAECPDCDGEGKRPSDPTPPDREAIARLFAEALDCAKECIPTACACRQYADRAILALRGGE